MTIRTPTGWSTAAGPVRSPLGVDQDSQEDGPWPAVTGRRPDGVYVHVFAVSCPELERLPLDARIGVQDSDSWAASYPITEHIAEPPPFYPACVAQSAATLDG